MLLKNHDSDFTIPPVNYAIYKSFKVKHTSFKLVSMLICGELEHKDGDRIQYKGVNFIHENRSSECVYFCIRRVRNTSYHQLVKIFTQ